MTARPPAVPAHAGTGDIDIVVDLAVLADTEAYRTLEENLKRMGFERAENDKGVKVNWRWKTKTEHGVTVILEFLADDPKVKGGALQELPTEGNISAVNIPHASLVFDLHDHMEVTADLLGQKGRATETIPYANIVSFTCLKAFAFDHRREGKDAHDLVYCLEHGEGELDGAIAKFKDALTGKHAGIIGEALAILLKRFCDPKPDEGYLREGPVAVARFEIEGDDEDADIREQRSLRQRAVNDSLSRLLGELGIEG
ncbi:antitoxin [Mesorhizobium sp. M1312]|uniref:antitoxin n=1 Tax=unclassified Mesorhizobium TaxID=325217 RepID=UPI003337E545